MGLRRTKMDENSEFASSEWELCLETRNPKLETRNSKLIFVGDTS